MFVSILMAHGKMELPPVRVHNHSWERERENGNREGGARGMRQGE